MYMKKYAFTFLIFTFLLFGFSFINISTSFASDCVIDKTLRLGSRGEQVVCLQNYLGITADGNFGRKTKATVIAWQTERGLTPDGIFGPKSQASRNSFVLNFKEGCTSASGFSTTTGEPCKAADITITTPSVLPTAFVGTSYDFNPQALGGIKNFSSNNYTWSLSSGKLPPGLNIIEGVFINGIPSQEGTYTFSLSASDGTNSVVKDFILKVAPATYSVDSTGAN